MSVQQSALFVQKLFIFACYGSSETAGMVTLLESEFFLQGKEGGGTPLPHAEIRVNSANGHIELRSTACA